MQASVEGRRSNQLLGPGVPVQPFDAHPLPTRKNGPLAQRNHPGEVAANLIRSQGIRQGIYGCGLADAGISSLAKARHPNLPVKGTVYRSVADAVGTPLPCRMFLRFTL